MKKWILIALVVLAVIIIAAVIVLKWLSSSSPNYVEKLLKNDDVVSSFVLKENGEITVDYNSSKMMSLASAVKTVVAIEFSYQVESGKLNREEWIPLEELKKYYLPKLDGGAHEAWLKDVEEKGLIENGSIPLREVAKGMITYSSNANTDYLMGRLELDKIDDRIKKLGINNHSAMYYFNSGILIPYAIKERDFPHLSMKEAKEEIIDRIENMSEQEKVQFSKNIYKQLTVNPEYKDNANVLDWWDSDYDSLFSNSFIKSTTMDYVHVMSQINNREFPVIVQEEIEYLLGSLMENPKNQEWLERAGRKGGNTSSILTSALYAEDKEGNKYEFAIFFNELNPLQFVRLMNSLNEFELNVLRNESFREKLYGM